MTLNQQATSEKDLSSGANPKKVVRLFTGLAGSPMASVQNPTAIVPSATAATSAPEPQAKKRGRPSMNGQPMSATERKQRQREEVKRKEEIAKLEATQRREAAADANDRPIGMYMQGAGHGEGKLETGNYSFKKLDLIVAANDRAVTGQRVRPKGFSPNDLKSDKLRANAQAPAFAGRSFQVRLSKSDDELERDEVFRDMSYGGRCVVCGAENIHEVHVREVVEAETKKCLDTQERRSLLKQLGVSPDIFPPEPKPGDHVIHFDRLIRAERDRHKAVVKAAEDEEKKRRDQKAIGDAKQRPAVLAQACEWQALAEKRNRDFKNKKAREARAAKKLNAVTK